jgi:hypothetical protein
MGIIRMGAPTDLILELGSQFKVKNFVETGTFLGATAYWASQQFDRVITIEFSQQLYDDAIVKYKNTQNIEFLFGHSKTKLNELVNKLDGASIFWLDAHWSGGLTYGENDECPLIEEIDIINSSQVDHFILIDDARLFTAPPQSPHKVEHWPNISEVIDALRSKFPDKYIVIIDDVIIAVPSSAKPLVANYCQELNNKVWQEYQILQNKADLQKGFDLIAADVNVRIKSLLGKMTN